MDDASGLTDRLAAEQLGRMRGMVGMYHRRFFFDIQFSVVVILATGAAGFAIDQAMFLAIPFIALLGATQTAFDASYLIFARHYAAALERWLNTRSTETVLVAAELEDSYLFPLNEPKIVTLRLGRDLSWFGFMTAFYTLLGMAAYVTGLLLGFDALAGAATPAYVITLALLTALALIAGLWWFYGGEGERRLDAILTKHFG